MTYGARGYGARTYGDSSGDADATNIYVPVDVTVEVGAIASGEVVQAPTLYVNYPVNLPTIPSGQVVYAPRAFEPKNLTPRPIPSKQWVPGPRIIQSGLDIPLYTPRITAWTVNRATGAKVTYLDQSFARQWQGQYNDTGTASLTLQNGDPDLAAIQYGTIVRFYLDDEARFAMLVERKEQTTVAAGEEVDQITVVSGRGLLSAWEDMLVLPPLGVDRALFTDTRAFNFAAPELDDSGWARAIETLTLRDTPQGVPITPVPMPYPTGWPDPTARWIWDRESGVNGVPAGECYFRKTFTVATQSAAEVWAICDDAYELWIDGIPLMSDSIDYSGVSKHTHVPVRLEAGTHYLAVRGKNLNNLKAGLMVTVVQLDANGAVSGVLAKSDITWKVLGYPPSPPGFTPGRVIRVLRDEAVARGCGTIALRFDDTADSVGEQWPITADIAVQVGSDMLSVIRQLCETYMNVGAGVGELALYAYAGQVPEIGNEDVLAPLVNITELTHDGTG